tara:strand:- start:354 stop:878 length:525 start_codon:yes stop_codon:yes gene_type:complete
MARSRESVRQNKAMQSILRGETPEQRVMVGYDKKPESNHGDKIDRLSDIMKDARMPWFCPSCKKVMKKRLDNKMWILYNHCFECQLQIENKMRIAGTYEEWKNENIKKNKLAWINEQRQSIIEWKSQDAPTVFNQVSPDGHTVQKEKWLTDKKELDEKADEALNYLNELEESLQ